MDEIRIQLEERQKDEAPPVRFGMRDLEIGLVHNLLTVEQEIEVDGAGAPAL
jgi:hypothetical protein